MDKKLIIITGTSSGIGSEIARAFSKEGHPTLLIDRSGKSKEMNLPNSLSKRVDVTDLNSFTSAVKEAEELYGDADCIINNAGCMLLGEVAGQNPEEWLRMLNVNVLGVFNGVKTVLDKMNKNKTGTIFNISSIAGKKSFPNHAAYTATKFAVHGFSENLREEVASNNVRCITIAPGVVETNLLGHTTSNSIVSDYSDWKESIGGALSPKDIADVIYFAYSRPQNVCIREIVIAPTRQEP